MLDDLIARLRVKAQVRPPFGGGSITHDGKVTSYITDDGMRLVNPDGPEAATALEALRAERDALRGALEPRLLSAGYSM